MKYFHEQIEAKWQEYWAKNQTFAASNHSEKPKYYVLDMFPYPSGAGLHVGHPLGYIASDIVARYKRHKGFNVLHPQGYDSFGLPAEQYAIQTGQHPEKTTRENIARYREQLDKIGFSFDWSREVRTSNPDYYKWTQWIFIQLFNSWYNNDTNKAEDISTLVSLFEKEGNATVNAVCDDNIATFSSNEWNAFSSEEQQKILLQYRLTYLAETEVNWCPALGTVLANDEIVNGVSERGGHPVIRKKMTQWSMRISAYAERLLQGLNDIDWTESLKESQRNWIGKSVGAIVEFPILSFPKGEEKAADKKIAGYMTGGNNSHITIQHAKENRKNPTEAENILWNQLRNKNLGDKFRQQHLIDDFIVDFVCLSKNLIIEVDGGYHETKEQKELDEERTFILNKKGYKVIRFSNEEVLRNSSKVLEIINEALSSRTAIHVSAPSPMERVGVRIFTTRPDTIFGVTFMTLAPEHDLVAQITTPEQKAAVDAYIEATAKRSERERMADVKTISGVFTGAYAEHPFTKEPIPVWIGDYVLAGYGTGAVMAVPCGDERDYAFANFFKGTNGMPEIKNIFNQDISQEAFAAKEGFELVNSDFLNGLGYKEGTKKAIEALEKIGQGKGKTNYRLRDAVFSRQRYWGEPFPVYYVNGLPQMIDSKYLPIVLPEVEKYLPTEDGQPPLGNAKEWYWNTKTNAVSSPPSEELEEAFIFPLELNTMPGWAGSSWYWMRYMDAHNDNEFASEEALKYWQNVDLYIGGSEHATGHLLYSRFWNKFLKDKGFAPTEEPFKKLINQGMILGMSATAYNVSIEFNIDCFNSNKKYLGKLDFDKKIPHSNFTSFKRNYLVSKNKMSFHSKDPDSYFLGEEVRKEIEFQLKYEFIKSVQFGEVIQGGKVYDFSDISIVLTSFIPYKERVLLNLIDEVSNELKIEDFKTHPLYSNLFNVMNAEFILEDGKYIVGREVEKMSKSKYNVVNPDDICNEYGADTLRLYEMFLGPLEQAKPWNTAGITGVYGFLKKLWKLYHSGPNDSFYVDNSTPSEGLGEAFKSLHKTIKKVTEDIENFSFNTSVSQFMICVNELSQLKCRHRAILEPLAIIISPYAPHIAEELWSQLGHEGSIATVNFPVFEEKYLVESEKEYPVSFNGKMRFTIKLPLDLTAAQIEEIIMADERTIAQLAGNTPKKVIIVPGKIINLVG
ncbi:MAG: class I tRNA ligase family protein [Bacteroidetes bacterium]|uniref:leucine--tRNA ligase n=1 Tax=Flavobacterium sp. TaxID=239 RepID=UPI002FD9CF0F|nr:class I tRNA ligase family protein [Bacteroidota bacterium]